MGIINKIKRLTTAIRQLWILVRPFKWHLFLCLFIIVINSFVMGSFFSFLIPLVSNLVSKVETADASDGVIKYIFDFYLSISPDKRQTVFAVLCPA